MENQEITVKLTGAAWNAVLNILAQRPFHEVVSIINEIKSQAETQIKSTVVETEE